MKAVLSWCSVSTSATAAWTSVLVQGEEDGSKPLADWSMFRSAKPATRCGSWADTMVGRTRAKTMRFSFGILLLPSAALLLSLSLSSPLRDEEKSEPMKDDSHDEEENGSVVAAAVEVREPKGKIPHTWSTM
ncbi:hypothetical protein BKA56DRAFT_591541 [Ilyonectria sp. MPI-CAGE-AT-0026]|nr:hypothetical protein BKA56DRAFT_591541 [Ilyonectria sp. MPI-CAGE-AT-0026]